MSSFNPVAPPHAQLVLGRLADVSAFLHDHMFLADLKRSERFAFYFGETSVFQRAHGAVGLCPSEIVVGRLYLGFRDSGTFRAERASRTCGLPVGNVHHEGVGTEAFATMRWRADGTAEFVAIRVGLLQGRGADISRIGECLLRLALAALFVCGNDWGEAAMVAGNGGLSKYGGDDSLRRLSRLPSIFWSCFADLEFIADPSGFPKGALRAPFGVRVVRIEQRRTAWPKVVGAPLPPLS